MSWTKEAISAHARLALSGIKVYGVDNIPLAQKDIQLPCGFPVFFRSEQGLEKPNVTASTGDVTVSMDFLFLVEKPKRALDISSITESTIDAADAYLDALIADPDLDGTLSQYAIVSLSLGVYPWLDQDYAGFIASHTWTFYRG